MATMEMSEIMRHVGAFRKDEVKPMLQRVMRHYMWTWREGREKLGWCTACQQTIRHLEGLRTSLPRQRTMDEIGHNVNREAIYSRRIVEDFDGTTAHRRTGECPGCGEAVTFRALGVSRTKSEDRYFLVAYRRSAIEPETVVAVGYYAELDWWDMRHPVSDGLPLIIEPREACVFRWGKPGVRAVKEHTWCNMGGWDVVWAVRNRCDSGYGVTGDATRRDSTGMYMDKRSWKAAIKGTPWEKIIPGLRESNLYDAIDKIAIMDRASRYPCLEYLLAMGQERIAIAAVDGKNPWRSSSVGNKGHRMLLLNLRGKSPTSVMRLTRDEWAEIKGRKIKLDEKTLWFIQSRRVYGLRLGIPTCVALAQRAGTYEWVEINEHLMDVDVAGAAKYCVRKGVLLREYVDHLRACRETGVDMRDTSVIYPKDFHETHQRMIARRRILREEEAMRRRLGNAKERIKRAGGLNDKISKLIKRLGRYQFTACGLIMSPFESAEEVIMEGARQSICIGDYVRRYAEGKTILCKIRRADEPDKPFHAVEFTTEGVMVQCRGAHNRTLDVDEQIIRDFWAAWDEERGTSTWVELYIKETRREALTA